MATQHAGVFRQMGKRMTIIFHRGQVKQASQVASATRCTARSVQTPPMAFQPAQPSTVTGQAGGSPAQPVRTPCRGHFCAAATPTDGLGVE